MKIKIIYGISADVKSGQNLVGADVGCSRISADNAEIDDLWTADTFKEIMDDIADIQKDWACRLSPIKIFVDTETGNYVQECLNIKNASEAAEYFNEFYGDGDDDE